MSIGQFAVFFELAIAVVTIFVAVLVVRRYYQKKNKNILYLSVGLFVLALGVLSSMTSRILEFFLGIATPEIYIHGLFLFDHLAIMFIAIANYLFYLFSRGIFAQAEERKKFLAYTISLVAIVAFLFWAPIDPDSIVHTIGFLVAFLYCLSVFIPIILSSKRAEEKVDDPIYQVGFKALRYMVLSWLSVLLCFIGDQVYILLTDFKFGPFYFAGWIFELIGVFFAYIGFLLPEWVKKRVLHRVSLTK